MHEDTQKLRDIVSEFQKLSRSVDFIEESAAKLAIQAAVGKIHWALKAAVTEVYTIGTNTDREIGPLNVPAFQRYVGTLNEDAEKIKKDEIAVAWTILKEGNNGILERRPGLWTWVYDKGQPVWLNMQEKKREAKNLAPDVKEEHKKIPKDDVVLYNEYTDSTIIIPLKHKPDFPKLDCQEFWGLLNVELPKNREFLVEEPAEEPGMKGPLQFRELDKFTSCILSLMTKAAEWRANKVDTDNAIKKFNEYRPLYYRRRGFFAYPSTGGFDEIDNILFDFFDKKRIRLDCRSRNTRIDPENLEENQIDEYDFAVFDITFVDPVVMLNLGLTLRNKPTLVLQEYEDYKSSSGIPINIKKSKVVFCVYKCIKIKGEETLFIIENDNEDKDAQNKVPLIESKGIGTFVRYLKL